MVWIVYLAWRQKKGILGKNTNISKSLMWNDCVWIRVKTTWTGCFLTGEARSPGAAVEFKLHPSDILQTGRHEEENTQFNKYLLRVYCISGTILILEIQNWVRHNPYFEGAHIQRWRLTYELVRIIKQYARTIIEAYLSYKRVKRRKEWIVKWVIKEKW